MVTGRDEGHRRHQPSGEASAAPGTWPRDSRDRAQPRSRLDQALTIARTPSQPWVELHPAQPVASPVPDAETAGRAGAGAGSFSTDTATAGTSLSAWGAARAASPRLAEGTRGRQPGEPAEGEPVPDAQSAYAASVTGARPESVVDLRTPTAEYASGTARGGDYGLGRRWGASWRDAAQGWVSTGHGDPVWRPVVTTTDQLATWDVDTYLGVVTAEVAVEAAGSDFRQLGSTLARGRHIGIEGLVEEAIERGAHAVVGMGMQYTPIGDRLLMTITGTAVTLREKR